MIQAPRFTLEDADHAYDGWGANCGPGALAAILGMTLDEVRPHLIGFDQKRYTNPTMMFDALESLKAKIRVRSVADNVPHLEWPRYGLARIQWEGPWTAPGANPKWRYRQTHWVGAARRNGEIGIFDINCMNNGTGWCLLKDWSETIVPHLTALYPRASGKWHLTHSIEVTSTVMGSS
jgi:hypothetical protein